jgi:hypothetical protein
VTTKDSRHAGFSLFLHGMASWVADAQNFAEICCHPILSISTGSMSYATLNSAKQIGSEDYNVPDEALCSPPVQAQRYEVLRKSESCEELPICLADQVLTDVHLQYSLNITCAISFPPIQTCQEHPDPLQALLCDKTANWAGRSCGLVKRYDAHTPGAGGRHPGGHHLPPAPPSGWSA